MKGYDSVFDYLQAEQEVDRVMFDRLIDLIMKDFAPVAQRCSQACCQGKMVMKR